ncbi:hypothetical protein GCM10012278_56240 [Nonomuraea glycinis]|uniref:Uncharacterized protein n=1 Tax=Nonomuraea glycinis TaxID=2047744 RepID=A0A918E6Y4_9ACTN|nr:hypothetical protein GCM10012278_56240 [Nonomuraea glycinis]
MVETIVMRSKRVEFAGHLPDSASPGRPCLSNSSSPQDQLGPTEVIMWSFPPHATLKPLYPLGNVRRPYRGKLLHVGTCHESHQTGPEQAVSKSSAIVSGYEGPMSRLCSRRWQL